MLNEDKIRLMNEIATFEKKGSRDIFPVNRYFRGDFISSRMMRSFLSYTICFILCALICVLYNMEQFLGTVNLDGLTGVGRKAVLLYISGMVIYQLITWIVYRRRYEYAKRGMKVYVAKLKRLEKRYEFQNRAKELTKEGSRRDDATRT